MQGTSESSKCGARRLSRRSISTSRPLPGYRQQPPDSNVKGVVSLLDDRRPEKAGQSSFRRSETAISAVRSARSSHTYPYCATTWVPTEPDRSSTVSISSRFLAVIQPTGLAARIHGSTAPVYTRAESSRPPNSSLTWRCASVICRKHRLGVFWSRSLGREKPGEQLQFYVLRLQSTSIWYTSPRAGQAYLPTIFRCTCLQLTLNFALSVTTPAVPKAH